MILPPPPLHLGFRTSVGLSSLVFGAVLTSTAIADTDLTYPVLEKYINAASNCSTSFNETISSGTRCLASSGLSQLLDDGVQFANAYGKNTFGNHFQVVSDMHFNEGSLEGNLDFVVPVAALGLSANGTPVGSIFFQQGITRWWDAAGNFRNDTRYGLVHRFRTSDNPGADIIGVSAFYQHNLERNHQVVVSRIDYAGRWGTGVLRHYQPATKWLSASNGYRERALAGTEIDLRFDLTTTVRLDLTGYRWEDKDNLREWREGIHAGIDWQPHPWINFSTGFDAIGQKVNSSAMQVQVAIPFGSVAGVPRWEGLGLIPDRSNLEDSDLWRPVDDIGRIRYAQGNIVSAEDISVAFVQGDANSGDTIGIELSIPVNASEDIRLIVNLVSGEGDNPAIPGEDFVDAPIEATIEQGTDSVLILVELLRNEDMEESRSLGVTVSMAN